MDGINSNWGNPYAGSLPAGLGGAGTPSPNSGFNITPVTVANQMPSGYGLPSTALGSRSVSTHPSSLYVNVPGSMASTLGQMQDMMQLRDKTGMYSGFLNGVNQFNNCVININQGNPLPPAVDQQFQLWRMAPGAQAPMPVPVQTLAPQFNALPSQFGVDALSVYDQMLDVSIAQMLQCKQNLAVLRGQLAGMGCNRVIPSFQQSASPFMVPLNQVMANIQRIPCVAAGVPGITLPPINAYPLQSPAINAGGPFGQFFLQPRPQIAWDTTSLMARCPMYSQMPLQLMPGWSPFALGFGGFVMPGMVQVPGLFCGPPIIATHPYGWAPQQAVAESSEKMAVRGKPAAETPTKDKPVKAKPVKEEPVQEKPTKAKPVKEEPVQEKPVKAKPVKEEPVQEKPTKEKPVKEEPEAGKPSAIPSKAPVPPDMTQQRIERLVACCSSGKIEGLKQLQVEGVDLNATVASLGERTPLTYACQEVANPKFVESLLSLEGVDVNRADAAGDTPLALVMASNKPGSEKLIELLYQQKASVDPENAPNLLKAACRSGVPDRAACIFEHPDHRVKADDLYRQIMGGEDSDKIPSEAQKQWLETLYIGQHLAKAEIIETDGIPVQRHDLTSRLSSALKNELRSYSRVPDLFDAKHMKDLDALAMSPEVLSHKMVSTAAEREEKNKELEKLKQIEEPTQIEEAQKNQLAQELKHLERLESDQGTAVATALPPLTPTAKKVLFRQKAEKTAEWLRHPEHYHGGLKSLYSLQGDAEEQVLCWHHLSPEARLFMTDISEEGGWLKGLADKATAEPQEDFHVQLRNGETGEGEKHSKSKPDDMRQDTAGWLFRDLINNELELKLKAVNIEKSPSDINENWESEQVPVEGSLLAKGQVMMSRGEILQHLSFIEKTEGVITDLIRAEHKNNQALTPEEIESLKTVIGQWEAVNDKTVVPVRNDLNALLDKGKVKLHELRKLFPIEESGDLRNKHAPVYTGKRSGMYKKLPFYAETKAIADKSVSRGTKLARAMGNQPAFHLGFLKATEKGILHDDDPEYRKYWQQGLAELQVAPEGIAVPGYAPASVEPVMPASALQQQTVETLKQQLAGLRERMGLEKDKVLEANQAVEKTHQAFLLANNELAKQQVSAGNKILKEEDKAFLNELHGNRTEEEQKEWLTNKQKKINQLEADYLARVEEAREADEAFKQVKEQVAEVVKASIAKESPVSGEPSLLTVITPEQADVLFEHWPAGGVVNPGDFTALSHLMEEESKYPVSELLNKALTRACNRQEPALFRQAITEFNKQGVSVSRDDMVRLWQLLNKTPSDTKAFQELSQLLKVQEVASIKTDHFLSFLQSRKRLSGEAGDKKEKVSSIGIDNETGEYSLENNGSQPANSDWESVKAFLDSGISPSLLIASEAITSEVFSKGDAPFVRQWLSYLRSTTEGVPTEKDLNRFMGIAEKNSNPAIAGSLLSEKMLRAKTVDELDTVFYEQIRPSYVKQKAIKQDYLLKRADLVAEMFDAGHWQEALGCLYTFVGIEDDLLGPADSQKETERSHLTTVNPKLVPYLNSLKNTESVLNQARQSCEDFLGEFPDNLQEEKKHRADFARAVAAKVNQRLGPLLISPPDSLTASQLADAAREDISCHLMHRQLKGVIAESGNSPVLKPEGLQQALALVKETEYEGFLDLEWLYESKEFQLECLRYFNNQSTIDVRPDFSLALLDAFIENGGKPAELLDTGSHQASLLDVICEKHDSTVLTALLLHMQKTPTVEICNALAKQQERLMDQPENKDEKTDNKIKRLNDFKYEVLPTLIADNEDEENDEVIDVLLNQCLKENSFEPTDSNPYKAEKGDQWFLLSLMDKALETEGQEQFDRLKMLYSRRGYPLPDSFDHPDMDEGEKDA